MKDQFDLRDKILIAIILMLFCPALLVNLGYMTHIDDESIRSLVAMEIKLITTLTMELMVKILLLIYLLKT